MTNGSKIVNKLIAMLVLSLHTKIILHLIKIKDILRVIRLMDRIFNPQQEKILSIQEMDHKIYYQEETPLIIILTLLTI